MTLLKEKMFGFFVVIFLGILLIGTSPASANDEAVVCTGLTAADAPAAPAGQKVVAADSQKKMRVSKFKRAGSSTATVQLFGHVTLVEGYALPNYNGCHALVKLRDQPGKTIAVMTKNHKLQTILETALATGNLMCVWAKKLTNPLAPRGGTWNLDVYRINGIILYNMK